MEGVAPEMKPTVLRGSRIVPWRRCDFEGLLRQEREAAAAAAPGGASSSIGQQPRGVGIVRAIH